MFKKKKNCNRRQTSITPPIIDNNVLQLQQFPPVVPNRHNLHNKGPRNLREHKHPSVLQTQQFQQLRSAAELLRVQEDQEGR